MNWIVSPSFRGHFQRASPGAGCPGILDHRGAFPPHTHPHTLSFHVNEDSLINLSSFLDACAPTFLDAAHCKPPFRLHGNLMSHITLSVETPPGEGIPTPCVKHEELYLGDGFIQIPGAFIRPVPGSISSCTSSPTIELSGRDRVEEAMWEDLKDA